MTTPQLQFNRLNKAPNLDLVTRISRLKKLKSVITKNTDKIISALNSDYGQRSEAETRLAEIMICIAEINHTLKHIRSWVRPTSSLANMKFIFSKNTLIPQPLGVVGIIAPWNYPFNLAIAPLIAAISAGNKVMIKPSEVTPKTAEIIAEVCSQTFLDTEVAVSLGEIEVAQQFSQLPFMHLLFTGSTAVGKVIMQNAASNLTPVTLELGGKSPVIIDENYNFKKAAKSIVGGKFYNAGQTCIAPDYILVPENKKQALLDALQFEIKKCFPDILNNPDYTAIINDRHFNRLNELAEKSSKYQCVWPEGEQKNMNKNIFPPLLVVNPEKDSDIMDNEIFGPILPIISVQSKQEALDYINNKPNPLTLYVFSNNKKFIKHSINNTLSGSVAVNETLVQFAQDGISFGGVGESGMGSYHGYNGFKSFSHFKSVYYQTRLNFNAMVRAPYTPFKKKVINLLSKL
jgi:coniferyl-aldehyde dehydrogenase